MNTANNIIQFRTPNKIEDSKKVYPYFESFFERMKQGSKNTEISYRKSVSDFILFTRGKKIEDVVEDDIKYTLLEVENYQLHLSKTMKSSSINTKMMAIKKCFTKLASYGLDVDASVFSVDRFKLYDTDSYDAMSIEEILKAIEVVSKTYKGTEKALFIKVAFSTAFRKTSLMNLKWSDITMKDGIMVIKTLGKGNKWDEKKLSDGLYLELMEFKKTVGDREKIFTLAKGTIDKMMNLIKENIDFGDRNIAFHSFKKSSIEEVARLTNYDIKAMQSQANHSDVSTTLNFYMSHKKLEDMVVVDLDYEIPLHKFDSMSKEELLDLIKKSDRNTQLKLLNMIGE